MSKDENLYKTSLGFTPLLFWVIDAILLTLVLSNMQLNPAFFSFLALVLIAFGFFVKSESVIVTHNGFEISRNWFFNSVKKSWFFKFDEALNIELYDSTLEIGHSYIPLIPNISGKKIVVTHKNGEFISFKDLNLRRYDINDAVDIIRKKIPTSGQSVSL